MVFSSPFPKMISRSSTPLLRPVAGIHAEAIDPALARRLSLL
jgi:hypothetical protein